LFLLFFVPALVLAEDAPPAPKVKVENPVFDFGTVSQGAKVSHDFAIKNEGNADLNIHRIVPACGCTAASSGGDRIAPGQMGTVKVELDTTDISGSKLRLVRVFTSDMNEPMTTLTLKGNVEPNVKIEPNRVAFNNVTRSASTTPESREVRIAVKPESGLQLAGIKSFSKLVKVDVREQGPQGAVIAVSLDPSAPVGEVRERLVVNLRGEREMSVNIPVFANVQGPLKLNPGTLSFGIVEGAEPIERSVKFENTGPKPVAIKKLVTSDPALSADYAVIKDGTNYVIHVKLDPTKVTQDLRAVVSVETDSATEGPLALNVFGVRPPKS
jgi:hypothetical protein